MNKQINFLCLVLLVLVSFGAVFAAAQTLPKKEKAAAWKQFQQAIARNDKRAVAKMIVFPFEASIAGDEFDYKIESEAEFLKNYDKIFTAPRRKKIQAGKMIDAPGEDEFGFEMTESGGAQVFTFRKIEAVYKLVGTMAAG